MLKGYALRFHRWIKLVFAVPLIVVIVTSLILSFEPLAQQTRLARPLIGADVLAYLDKHDASCKATGLSIRAYENTLLIAGVVTRDGLVQSPRNWPRAIHEGNWSPVLAPVLNIIVSVVFVGLWVTGLRIWARRKIRLSRRKVHATGALQSAE